MRHRDFLGQSLVLSSWPYNGHRSHRGLNLLAPLSALVSTPVCRSSNTLRVRRRDRLDGQLYSSLLPQELRDLPVPPRGASEEEKLAYEAKFNLRALWRMVRHAAPDDDGATR
ncbi:MAG: hypothetical protein ABSB99_08710 [Acidimicrobiales bacterium]